MIYLLKKFKAKCTNIWVRIVNYRIKKSEINKPGVYFILDPKYRKIHPGLTDRIKAIISVYYIAKYNDMDFYLIHKISFDINKYLSPNKVAWNGVDQLSRSYFDTIMFKYDPYSEIPILSDKNKQYHCYEYIGKNILELKNINDWKTIWKEHYDELFKNSEYLDKLIEENKPVSEYIGVHIRFVNALEKFEKSSVNSELDVVNKQKLIQKCIDAIYDIEEKEQKPVVVFSDSSYFLNYVKGLDMLTLDSKCIGHVSFCDDDKSIDKTFVDLYVLSQSEKIYSIQGDVLYASAFSKYSALIGDKEYKIYNLS